MIQALDYSAREFLDDQRTRLGNLYTEAMWTLRAFENEAKNRAARAQFEALYPSLVRLYEQPPLPVRPAPEAAVIQIRRVP